MTHRKTRSREGWTRVRFGDVVRLATERCADPLAAGIGRYVGLEHLEPSDLRIRTWGNVADGVTFTNRFHPGQVLFGKRRAYQRKVAVADFDGVCSGDIYVFEPADDRLLPELLPFICQTEGFFEHALKTSAGSLSPRTNWKSLQEYEFDLPPVEEQERALPPLHLADRHHEALQDVYSTSCKLISAFSSAFEKRHPETGLLSDAVIRLEPGSSPPSTGVGEATGPAVLKVSAVGDWTFNEGENKGIDLSYFDSSAEVRPGDILFTRANADVTGVARSCIVTECRRQLMLSDKTWRAHLRPTFMHFGPALVAVSKGARFRAHVERVLAGTEAKNISQHRLLSAPIPSASTSEWRAFNDHVIKVLTAYHAASSRADNRVAKIVSRHVLQRS